MGMNAMRPLRMYKLGQNIKSLKINTKIWEW